jgi:hypothetical protein
MTVIMSAIFLFIGATSSRCKWHRDLHGRTSRRRRLAGVLLCGYPYFTTQDDFHDERGSAWR